MTGTGRSLTITAWNQTKVYGNVFTFARTECSTGAGQLVNGDSVTSVTLTSAGTVATAAVGPYTITASAAVGSGLSNYIISYAPGTLTVTGRALTITASNQTKVYGNVFTFAGTEFSTGAG